MSDRPTEAIYQFRQDVEFAEKYNVAQTEKDRAYRIQAREIITWLDRVESRLAQYKELGATCEEYFKLVDYVPTTGALFLDKKSRMLEAKEKIITLTKQIKADK